MSKAQILRKRTGIVLAIIGIILSLLPAVRMADGSKMMLIQLINKPEFLLAGNFTILIFLIIMGAGLLIHLMNLILWSRNKLRPYIGVTGFSIGSFIAMIMYTGIISLSATSSYTTEIVAGFPVTVWQCLRIPVILFEAINRISGEEFFEVFFGDGQKENK